MGEVPLCHKETYEEQTLRRIERAQMKSISRRQLMKAGVAGTASTALLASQASALSFNPTYSNWSGNVSFKPGEVECPKSLDKLQSIVARANKVRAVGTRHSFNRSMATESTFILTDELNQILGIDQSKMQIKAEAGLKLHQLNEILDEMGWCLPSLGDIAEQSLAGLVSTGTHGTGLEWGSFSDKDALIALEIVTEDGSLIEINENSPEAVLKAGRLALGTLGVVYSVTFQCAPAHNLELISRVVLQSEILDPSWYLENDHFEFFLFPFTDKAQIILRNITTKPVDTDPVETWFNDVFLENFVLGTLITLQSLNPSEVKNLMEFIASLAQEEQHVGKSYEIMASQRYVKFFETEYCFPIDAVQDVMAVVEDASNFFANADEYYANFPSEVRFIRGDQGNLLTPTLGRDSMFFALQAHPSFGDKYLDYFKVVEQEFIKLGGHPHWGKMYFQNPFVRHPNANAFESVRKTFDPNGKFINPFLEKLMSGENLG